MATENTAMTTTVLAEGFAFLEGPRWHDNALWLSDMLAGRVYRISMSGTAEVVAHVPHRPSGLGFLPDGKLLIVSMRDRRLLRREADGLVCHADLSHLVTSELNDMVVDAHGRAYVGAFGFEDRTRKAFDDSRVILVHPDGKSQIVARGLAFPNGCVIRPPRRLVLAETFGQRLTEFDIAGDGTLHNARVFADLGDISPDGLCLDQEGGIWVASANQPWFVRILETGDITHRIHLPGRQAVACELGGPQGRTLFCLTVDKDFENAAGQSLSARVDIVTVETPGHGQLDT
jgi:sugar lactone lactonase YvrE